MQQVYATQSAQVVDRYCFETPLPQPLQRFKRTLLWSAATVMSLVAGLLLMTPMMLSMSATNHDLLAASKIFPKAELEALKAGDYRCLQASRFSLATCIYHRSAEQLAALRSKTSFEHVELAYGGHFIPMPNSLPLRSFRPDYFVFWPGIDGSFKFDEHDVAHHDGSGWYFYPSFGFGHESYSRMEIFHEPRMISGKLVYGGIHYSWDSDYWRNKTATLFDLAGYPVSYPWVSNADALDALYIPVHYYNENGDLVLGHHPNESYANRFSHWLKQHFFS